MSAKVTHIVASQSFLSQSAALSPVTLFSPAADGDFRLSFYFEQGAGATFAFARFDWTDDSGAQQKSGNSVSPGEFDQLTIMAHATANNQITIQATASGTINYSLFATVEEL